MDKILLLDDNKHILETFSNYFREVFSEEDIELFTFSENEAFINFFNNHKDDVKAWIVDLAKNRTEEQSGIFDIAEVIKENYNKNRIPIFIHSGQLAKYNEFSDSGTVFKIPKSDDSYEKITASIKNMYESGFLNIFCTKGKLEKELMTLLHNSFINQFKSDDIEKIITSITNDDRRVDRTYEIFQRLSIKHLLQDITATSFDTQISVNPVEYYYRRSTENLPVWTGDIFRNKINKEYKIILTPRCDLTNGKKLSNYLVCNIDASYFEHLEGKNQRTKEKNFQNSIKDNIARSKERYLPVGIRFSGGKIELNKYETITVENFNKNFDYVISVTDDLTNDIVRKFANHISRGGFAEMHFDEGKKYLPN